MSWWKHHHTRIFEETVIMILKSITDNLAALNTSVATLSAKVDAVVASGGPGSATPAEQQTIADEIAKTTGTVDAISAKLP